MFKVTPRRNIPYVEECGYEFPESILVNHRIVEKEDDEFGLRGKYYFWYKNKQYILKLDPDGWNQGEKEHRLWNKLSETDRKFFLPCLAYGQLNDNHYIIQEVVEFDYPEDHKLFTVWDNTISPVCSKYDLNDVDFDGHNWGFVNGQPVIYDYGV